MKLLWFSKMGLNIFVMTAILVSASFGQVIKISYGGFQEMLQPYFLDIDNQFYVDIGAYDPYFLSLSQQLYLQGWTGLNVDAGYQRLRRFMKLRPGTLSINQAVDNQTRYVDMFEMPDDSASGINAQFQFTKQYQDEPQKFKGEVYKMPTISMKDLCERFFEKKPVFLTMDVEGNEARALSSNDWSNPKCRPQLILAEIIGTVQTNKEGVKLRNGQPPIQQVMQKNGYKVMLKSSPNSMWVQPDRYEFYKNKAELYLKQEKQKQHKHIIYQFLMQQLFVQFLGQKQYFFLRHYDAQTYPLYLHVCKRKEPLVISNLVQSSRKIYNRDASRPIFVFQFNPQETFIFKGDANISSIQTIKVNYRKEFDLHFWCLRVKLFNDGQNGQGSLVYILDHQYMKNGEPLRIEDFKQQVSNSYSQYLNIVLAIIIIALTIIAWKYYSLSKHSLNKSSKLNQFENVDVIEEEIKQ